ncbi:hypothetical protein TELCIR_24124 [Teladorsagia circumcincta]|uniref:Uncharacterized protein n=1 Tax=Teladorsagia circumcincta TaxID=45464 RepID=A0A2G9TAE0_TELCI|nr:hypothetical protein TELCIR_24124 [Teladorsagia circumcincta]
MSCLCGTDVQRNLKGKYKRQGCLPDVP